MSTGLCTTLGLVHLIRRCWNLLDTAISNALPISPLVVTAAEKANRGSTLAIRSTGRWKGHLRNLWNEALPKTTSSFHAGTSILLGRGKTRAMSQQGCSDPPGHQSCRNGVMRSGLGTEAVAHTPCHPD